MPRGSKPGERRGGRQRATPNSRTVLTNITLAAAADNPASTVNELVLVLAKDHGLPADIRMAVARKASLFGSSRSMHGRSVAPNGHGSKPETKTGPDRDKGGGAIAAKAGLATDLLFAIARDTAAKAADRCKAALQIAEFFLPKDTGGKNHVAAGTAGAFFLSARRQPPSGYCRSTARGTHSMTRLRDHVC
jgi:hypothetical protein